MGQGRGASSKSEDHCPTSSLLKKKINKKIPLGLFITKHAFYLPTDLLLCTASIYLPTIRLALCLKLGDHTGGPLCPQNLPLFCLATTSSTNWNFHPQVPSPAPSCSSDRPILPPPLPVSAAACISLVASARFHPRAALENERGEGILNFLAVRAATGGSFKLVSFSSYFSLLSKQKCLWNEKCKWAMQAD